MALDGGQDGLRFYRGMMEIWVPNLRPGGWISVEIGEEQGPGVRDLFAAEGLTEIQILQDFAGLDRVVRGHKPYHL